MLLHLHLHENQHINLSPASKSPTFSPTDSPSHRPTHLPTRSSDPCTYGFEADVVALVDYGTEFTSEEECSETNELESEVVEVIYGAEAAVAIIRYDDSNTNYEADFNLDRGNCNDF